FVGQSPQQFKTKSDFLYQYFNLFKDKNSFTTPLTSPSSITCHIQTPSTFKGLVFVGLFPRPIPDQRPIMGAVLYNEGTYTFSQVPEGIFYILAAAIKWSKNPKDYFILDQSLRGKVDDPIKVRKA